MLWVSSSEFHTVSFIVTVDPPNARSFCHARECIRRQWSFFYQFLHQTAGLQEQLHSGCPGAAVRFPSASRCVQWTLFIYFSPLNSPLGISNFHVAESAVRIHNGTRSFWEVHNLVTEFQFTISVYNSAYSEVQNAAHSVQFANSGKSE